MKKNIPLCSAIQASQGSQGLRNKILTSPEENLRSCHAEQNGSLLAGHGELAAGLLSLPDLQTRGASRLMKLLRHFTLGQLSNASSGRSTLQANARAGTKKQDFSL